MKIRLTANAGLLLNISNTKILIDGLHNKETVPFCSTPPALLNSIINGSGVFSQIDALLFTHTHPDHYDKECTDSFLRNHNESAFICPALNENAAETEIYTINGVTVEARRLPHEGEEFKDVCHYGFFIYDNRESIFISGDAALKSEPILNFLDGRKPYAAALSFPFITLVRGRKIVESIDPRFIIAYHLPFENKDTERYIESCKRATEKNDFNRQVIILCSPNQTVEI